MEPVQPQTSRRRRPGVTPDGLRSALGVLWILDGVLSFQPQMFHQLVAMFVQPNVRGQPGAIAYAISHVAHFLGRDVGLWTVVLGLVQIGIGVGILWRRSLRTALVVSFVFGLGVWWIGEGFSGILDGHASPLLGAPGAVVLYGLIGILVWPRATVADPGGQVPTGLSSAPGAAGRYGVRPLVAGWVVFWALSAVFWALPANRATDSIQHQLAGAAGGQPGWYAHMLNSLSHAFIGSGTAVAVFLVALSMVVALGPLVTRRPEPFIVLGALLAIGYWLTGEAVGGLLTGMATDPNLGPLVVILGLALWPARPLPDTAPVPAAAAMGLRPGLTSLLIGALVVGPVAVSAVPLAGVGAAAGVSNPAGVVASAAGGSTASAMSSGSMNMGSSHSTASGSSAGAMGSMNMADAAGLGVTDPSWSYTGPALPPNEVSLLTTVSAETDAGHQMQTPDCTTKPTAQQILGAMEYVQATSAAVAKYKLLSAAVAAGYRPVTSTLYPVVHYLNPAYDRLHYAMDPNHIDSLVYAFTPDGPVLVAAMYLLPRSGQKGPMPYGCLVQWHAHTNLCYSPATGVIDGFTPCPPGTFNIPTGMMTHVWQVPVAGGPLALDPSDLDVVEAAIMAQENGLAPITSPTGQVTYQTASTATVGTF
ncbi:MAG: hypothetical protein ACYCS2_02110 [Acidimicrobiales bacterium]